LLAYGVLDGGDMSANGPFIYALPVKELDGKEIDALRWLAIENKKDDPKTPWQINNNEDVSIGEITTPQEEMYVKLCELADGNWLKYRITVRVKLQCEIALSLFKWGFCSRDNLKIKMRKRKA
jgi:hypothetical protein